MVTREERQEVAKRLYNHNEIGYNEKKLSSVIWHIKQSIYEGANIHADEREQLIKHNDLLLDILAELIEPEPEKISRCMRYKMAYAFTELDTPKIYFTTCTNCAGEIMWQDQEPSYCPHCAAKIIT